MKILVGCLIFFIANFVDALSYGFIVTFVNETSSDALLECTQFEMDEGEYLYKEKHEFLVYRDSTLEKSFNDGLGSQLECSLKSNNAKLSLSANKIDMAKTVDPIYIKSHNSHVNLVSLTLANYVKR